MNIGTLNEILDFVGVPFLAIEKIQIISGQRQVYVASSKEDDNKYVIKVSILEPTATARLQREIKILNNLSSKYFPRYLHNSFVTPSNLADYYDNFTSESERKTRERIIKENVQPFFVTVEPFVEHITWASCAKDLKKEVAIVDLLIHIISAMIELWNAKIVHRDLKPDNILLRHDLTPLIIDLGIAKSFNDGTVDLTHAFFNTPCTPRFASPEQLTNNKEEITYKTDQFSIGVIVFLVLCGEFPYGDYKEIGPAALLSNFNRNKVLNIQKYNDGISEELTSVIYKLIQVKPYKRFRDPRVLLQKLYDIKGSL